MSTRTPWAACTAILIAVMLTGCSARASAPDASGTYTSHTLVHNDLERTYLLVVPEELTPAMPVILALHGGGANAQAMCDMPGGLVGPAREAGYLIVCPQGFERHWNDGRGIADWEAHTRDIDDVGFLMALIQEISDRYPIDLRRVYASGISNGGLMSYRLGCQAADAFRAIAPVVASMAADLECSPSASISVMVINGTEDPLVPYSGGQIKALRRRLGEVLPTEQVIGFWAAHNGCTTEPEVAALPDHDPQDGTRVWREQYGGCASGEMVMLYRVEGGGHTWPGGDQYLPRFLIGRLSKDMQASEQILAFFELVGENQR